MNDSSMIPTFLVSRLVRQHCTVALGGDGADEMFGGYEQHKRVLQLQSSFQRIPLRLRKMLSAVGVAALPTGLRGRNWIEAFGVDFDTKLPFVATHFGPRERRALMGKEWRTTADGIRDCRIPRQRTCCNGIRGWTSRTTCRRTYWLR